MLELMPVGENKEVKAPGPAARVLSCKERWCQGRYAADAMGRHEFPESDNAVRFCLIGAMRRAYRDEKPEVTGEAWLKLVGLLDGKDTAAWNDAPWRTWEEVHNLLLKAGV